MKKIVKPIILILMLIAIAFIYGHIDKKVLIYDRDIDTSEYVSTGVLLGEGISQTFVSAEDELDGVNVKCSVVGNISKVVMNYKLVDLSTGKEVRGEVPATKLKHNKFYTFRFDKIKGCMGKEYQFVLQAQNGTEATGVGIYYEKTTEANTTLEMQGNSTPGTAILRTITHRFDLETFIVFLSFGVYIVVFMKLLYKLFR